MVPDRYFGYLGTGSLIQLNRKTLSDTFQGRRGQSHRSPGHESPFLIVRRLYLDPKVPTFLGLHIMISLYKSGLKVSLPSELGGARFSDEVSGPTEG